MPDANPIDSEENIKTIVESIAKAAEKLIRDQDAEYEIKFGPNYVFVGNVPKDPQRKKEIEDALDLLRKHYGS